MKLRALLAGVVVVVIASLAAAGGAVAKGPACPGKAYTLVHDSYGRAWHAKGSLYSCTTVYGKKRVVRLGPWKSGSKLAWEATQAVWSVPNANGDRIYAGSTESGKRWLLGTRALGASEARVQRVFTHDPAGAWVTKAGAVVFAQHEASAAPTAIGALPTPPTARGPLVVVGTWTGLTPTDLGRTVKIDEANGDGDECGGGADYSLTVAPDASAPTTRIGVTWSGYWERPFCG